MAIPLSRDLRSDALTQPTESMWTAMRGASLTWATAREDRTVIALEERASEVTGKAAAVLCPTGTVANLAALLVHGRPGERVLLDADAHVLWSEGLGVTVLGGLLPTPITRSGELPTPADVSAGLDDERFGHAAGVGALSIENTHNFSGGQPIGAAEMARLCGPARDRAVAVHLDGARIFNAAVATHASVAQLAEHADSVMFNLTKGLSAPMGAVLCGSAPFVEEARVVLHRLGATSIHQAGIWAAAGLVALDEAPERIANDHAVARELAQRLSEVDGLDLDPEQVRTNLLKIGLRSAQAAEVVSRLAALRVGAYRQSQRIVRLAVHRHIVVAAVEEIANAFERALDDVRQPAS